MDGHHMKLATRDSQLATCELCAASWACELQLPRSSRDLAEIWPRYNRDTAELDLRAATSGCAGRGGASVRGSRDLAEI